MKNLGQRKKTTLFAQIMGRLSVPLLLLAAVFMTMQLTNKINSLHELHQIQSRLAFNAIHQNLSKEFQKATSREQLTLIQKTIETLESLNNVEKIEIYDLLKREPVIEKPGSDWTSFDFRGMEESLFQRQEGKSYYVRVHKERKNLIAYIPLSIPETKEVFMARVSFSLASVKDALAASRWALALVFIFIILAGAAIGHGLAKSIIMPIRNLNEVTDEIMKGHLGKQVEIHTGDEIEELAQRFNRMSIALKDMKQQAEDANPLTQLPGNQGIFRELSKRIHERQKFVLFHGDLDRFKIFNDHYGLANGDLAIKKTAELLKDAVQKKGSPDDFVGHQGGDDFVIITRPAHAHELANYICQKFTSEVARSLYSKEDFDRGYTLHLDRRRQARTGEQVMVRFPHVSISIAGVSNAKKDFADYSGCMNAAIQAKNEAKKIIESSYIILD